MEHASTVDIGARKRRRGGINEDSVATAVLENHHRETGRPVGIFVLGDGVGGEASGDVASFLATSIVRTRLVEELAGPATDVAAPFDVEARGAEPPTAAGESRDRALSEGEVREAIQDAVDEAHQEVQQYARDLGARPATTIVVAVYADGKLHYGWVGDSRLYVVNQAEREIAQLTRDHAVTNEMLERGEIEDEAYARVHEDATAITNAVGGSGHGKPSVDVEFGTADVYAEDVVLLTSDGLIDAYPDVAPLRQKYERADDTEAVLEEIRDTLVTDDEIRDVVLNAPNLHSAAESLVDLANDRGGKDNLSLALATDPDAEPTPDDLSERGAAATPRGRTAVDPADSDDGGDGDSSGTDADARDSDGSDGGAAARASSAGGTSQSSSAGSTSSSGSSSGSGSSSRSSSSSAGSSSSSGASSRSSQSGAASRSSSGEERSDRRSGDGGAAARSARDAGGADADEAVDVADLPPSVDVVSVGEPGEPRAALAIPSEDLIVEIAGTVTVGRAGGDGDAPDVPLEAGSDATVERVNAAVEVEDDGSGWCVRDTSSSGTYVEVGDGEWLLLLSSEGAELHRQHGFDPGEAADHDIHETTPLEDGTAFTLEDPRSDDAVTCEFYGSLGAATQRFADGADEAGTEFTRFLT